jgi:hypothetical protein
MWAIADRRDTGSAAHEARAARRPVGGARPGASASGENASPIAAHARHATAIERIFRLVPLMCVFHEPCMYSHTVHAYILHLQTVNGGAANGERGV